MRKRSHFTPFRPVARPSLQEPYRRFLQETEWLRRAASEASGALTQGPPPLSPLRLPCEMAVVRLHDAWSRFSRELIVLSAGAKPSTAAGVKLPLAPGVA